MDNESQKGAVNMLAHLKIMSTLHIFRNMNTTRIAEFADLTKTKIAEELSELSEAGIIAESTKSTDKMKYWELTEKGTELLKFYSDILTIDFRIRVDTLRTDKKEKCIQILSALEKSEKSRTELSNELGIVNKELDLFLVFLEKTNQIQIDVVNDTLCYKLKEREN